MPRSLHDGGEFSISWSGSATAVINALVSQCRSYDEVAGHLAQHSNVVRMQGAPAMVKLPQVASHTNTKGIIH